MDQEQNNRHHIDIEKESVEDNFHRHNNLIIFWINFSLDKFIVKTYLQMVHHGIVDYYILIRKEINITIEFINMVNKPVSY